MDGDSSERDGAHGLDWTQIPDQIPFRAQRRFIDVNRLVAPNQAPIVLDIHKHYNGFSLEEQLDFAIASKHSPKDFLWISKQIAGRTAKDCILHYYRNKHDGRFETELPQDREKEAKRRVENLPPNDRRRPENYGNNGLEIISAQLGRADLTQLIPLDLEIERLFAYLPAAQHPAFRRRLEIATQSHVERLEAKAKLDREDEKRQRQERRNEAKARREKGKATATETIEEPPKKPSFDAEALFGRIYQSLDNMRHGVAALLRAYAEAAYKFDANQQDLQLQELHAYHQQRLSLINRMLRVLLDESEEMDQEFDKEFAELGREDLVTQLALCLISAKTGMVKLRLDMEVHEAKIDAFPKKATRRGGTNDQLQALRNVREEREMHLVQLKSLVEMLLEFMEDEREETDSDEAVGDNEGTDLDDEEHDEAIE